MNQMSQQPGYFQGQQGQLGQQGQFSNNYQPSGFVQSHYQGQLSEPTFNQNPSSIVQSPIGGYQATNQHSYSSAAYLPSHQQNAGMMQHQYQPNSGYQSHTSHYQVPSYTSHQSSANYGANPVISHLGYQSSPQQHYVQSHTGYANQNFSSGGYAGLSNNMSNNQNQTHGGMPVQSATGQNPVYHATNAYAQSGPVISHLGWQAGQNR
ncbi:hypothetical protein [Paenibacillus sp. Leaf72]|uniref:hypothetical protein n=1 Tax=Paenibacillus sp. Leaf72 TaxID=1736234 RepID=UPI0006FE1609|nr:hypothetical protein [Paenibacillus sp. Leaf72]KQO04594.1 hypothetical protein ASF12_13765 [Paenibacillus sp. Leaf72]